MVIIHRSEYLACCALQGVSRSAEPIVEATADTGAFTTTPVVASDVVIVVETDAAPEPTVDAAAVVDKAVDSAEEVVNEVADSVKEVAEGSVEALEKAVDELPSGEEVIDAAEKVRGVPWSIANHSSEFDRAFPPKYGYFSLFNQREVSLAWIFNPSAPAFLG